MSSLPLLATTSDGGIGFLHNDRIICEQLLTGTKSLVLQACEDYTDRRGPLTPRREAVLDAVVNAMQTFHEDDEVSRALCTLTCVILQDCTFWSNVSAAVIETLRESAVPALLHVITRASIAANDELMLWSTAAIDRIVLQHATLAVAFADAGGLSVLSRILYDHQAFPQVVDMTCSAINNCSRVGRVRDRAVADDVIGALVYTLAMQSVDTNYENILAARAATAAVGTLAFGNHDLQRAFILGGVIGPLATILEANVSDPAVADCISITLEALAISWSLRPSPVVDELRPLFAAAIPALERAVETHSGYDPSDPRANAHFNAEGHAHNALRALRQPRSWCLIM